MGRCMVWDPFRNSHPDDVDDHVYVGGVPYPNNANIQIKTPRQDNLYIMTMMFSPVTAESSCEDRQSHRQAISHQAALVGPRSPPGLQICHNFSQDIHNQQAIPRCKKIYRCKFDHVLLNFTFHNMVRSNPTKMFSKIPIVNNFPLSTNVNYKCEM